MAEFPGIYRAQFLNSDKLGNVTCTVPAVTGNVPVTALSSDLSVNLQAPLTPGALGWVVFEGGDPSLPVWMGTAAPVVPPPLSYWFSSFGSPASITGGAGKVQLQPNTPMIASGFHRHPNATVVVCDVAGFYRVGIHLTEQISSSTVAYSDTYIEIHDPSFVTITASSNPVGMGSRGNLNDYLTSDGELIAYIPAGYFITVMMAADATRSFQASRSYLSIMPVGGGFKGDKGDRGLAGGTSTAWTTMIGNAGWSNYGSGYAQAAYRLHDDVVECRGLVVSSGATAALTTLPAGFRPPAGIQLFTCVGSPGAVRVDVSSTGDITYGAPIAYLDLSTIRFSTTA